MKTLNFEQMEKVEGGSFPWLGAAICLLGVATMADQPETIGLIGAQTLGACNGVYEYLNH